MDGAYRLKIVPYDHWNKTEGADVDLVVTINDHDVHFTGFVNIKKED